MGKDGGSMTAKAVAKRIKAKGLGKLRWYCQMCEKQCRDENGFKNHTQSAGHQRQLSLFSEDPEKYISSFSHDFRREFLSVLRQRHGTTFVNANSVYQEHIKHKDHVHMNSTQWTTLSDFVKDLGKAGHCKVQERDDGFWVSYVDREVAERDRAAREMDRQILEEEHRAEVILQRQISAVKSAGPTTHEDSDDDQVHSQSSGKTLQIHLSAKNRHQAKLNAPALNIFESLSKRSDERDALNTKEPQPVSSKRRKSRWQDAPEPPDAPKLLDPPKPPDDIAPLTSDSNLVYQPCGGEDDVPWLHKSIIVKVKSKQVAGGAFYDKKGKVVDIVNDFGARVSMLDSDTELELDQDDLQTVIPKPGGMVLILSGARRGRSAIIESINVDAFNVSIALVDSGEKVTNVEYETVSRIALDRE